MEHGKVINKTVMVFIYGEMEINMKVNGLTIRGNFLI